jgi:ABC-type Fe3+ transport system substrate-binding protein
LFDRAEAVRPGARAHLVAHAQALVGGRDSAPSPPGAYPAKRFLVDGTVDLFLTYASNAATMGAEFDLVWPPDELAVGASYGLIVLKPGAVAEGFAAWIGSAAAQALLVQNGFIGM